MSYLDLLTSAASNFGGSQREFRDADYVVIGVPFDATSTYRCDSRFAPLAIREASLNIETYSFRAKTDFEELMIHDAGDLHVSAKKDVTLKRLESVTDEILGKSKTPVFIGGEHTITLGIAKGIGRDFTLISFDAHLDLRDEYMDEPVCHATSMRRINEAVRPAKIVEVGIRAVCKEEMDYAANEKIDFITSQYIAQFDTEKCAAEIKRHLVSSKDIYLSVDMDVLDPAYAPAVQNPEPDGLSTHTLLDILSEICDRHIIAFDVVEVAPHYDMGTTALQAARIIFDTMSHLHKDKNERSHMKA